MRNLSWDDLVGVDTCNPGVTPLLFIRWERRVLDLLLACEPLSGNTSNKRYINQILFTKCQKLPAPYISQSQLVCEDVTVKTKSLASVKAISTALPSSTKLLISLWEMMVFLRPNLSCVSMLTSLNHLPVFHNSLQERPRIEVRPASL